MEKKELYAQFCNQIWVHFEPSELTRNRKAVAFRVWLERSKPAQEAIRKYLALVGPIYANPYYYIRNFSEPVPTDYNGSKSLPDEPMVIAVYNGRAGIYTKQDAEDYEMEIKQPFKL